MAKISLGILVQKTLSSLWTRFLQGFCLPGKGSALTSTVNSAEVLMLQLPTGSLFRVLVDQLEDDAIILDDNFTLLDANRYALERRFTTREAVLGKPCQLLDPALPCQVDESVCSYLLARATNAKAENTSAHTMPDGKIRYLNTVCIPLPVVESSSRIFFYLCQDVTEKYRKARNTHRVDAENVMEQFCAYLAHEIRNPLFTIGGFANSLLRSPTLDANNKEKVRIILEQSRRLDTILKELIAFARPVTGQIFSIFSLVPLLSRAVEFISPSCIEGNINVTLEVEDTLPLVQGSAARMNEALQNILKNALEAMPTGGTLMIGGHSENGNVALTIQDNGCGIPLDMQEQVFSPFFTTKSAGVGLGLGKTRKIIEEMGGTLLLYSQPGQGTRIEIVLPAALAGDEIAVLDDHPVGAYA